ncbi:sigma-70 family RNA polymerase sigma factor [Polaribacter sp.]|nr:sigma-70 family RNA polymerase sigma factor [Polaribacter sp.]
MKQTELIHQCCQKKLTAQSQLYQLYADTIFVICLKYSKNNADAEDTLQDCFITIFDKIGQYNFKGSFEGWLKRIAINTALQKYRNRSSLEIVTDIKDEEDINDTNVDNEIYNVDVLLQFVQELPDRYRLVFNLYVLDDYSHKEISKLLNISENTSKSNLSRARKILKTKLITYKEKAAQ